MRLITLVFLCFSLCCWGQSVHELPIVYQIPKMQQVKVEKQIPFKGKDAAQQYLDLYYPSDFEKGQQLPVVVFANGGSTSIPEWRVYQDWARLVAANGFIAVNFYSTWDDRYSDLSEVLDFLHKNGTNYGINGDQIGVWACSGNVTAAYPQVMDASKTYLKSLVFYYGLPSKTSPPRQDLPLLLVRAGLDSYSLNTKIDQFLGEAMQADIPLEFINYLEGYHAFDILNDNERSKQIIDQTLSFLKRTLKSEGSTTSFVLTTRNFYDMIQKGQTAEALKKMRQLYQERLALGRPNRGYYRVAEEGSINGVGYQLIEDGLKMEAIQVLELNTELFPDSPNAYDSLADAYEANGEKEKAIEMALKTLKKLEQSKYSDQQKALIKESAEDKLTRLQKIKN